MSLVIGILCSCWPVGTKAETLTHPTSDNSDIIMVHDGLQVTSKSMWIVTMIYDSGLRLAFDKFKPTEFL